MDPAFDDEAEPAVTIGEYLEEVEERELVSLSHLVVQSIVRIFVTMNYASCCLLSLAIVVAKAFTINCCPLTIDLKGILD